MMPLADTDASTHSRVRSPEEEARAKRAISKLAFQEMKTSSSLCRPSPVPGPSLVPPWSLPLLVQSLKLAPVRQAHIHG